MVLHLIASNFFGGPEKQILMHAARACARGIRLGVAVFEGPGMNTDLVEHCAAKQVPVYRIKADRKIDLASLRRLRKLVHDLQVDILCSHGFKADVYNWVVSKIRRHKTIAFVRGDTAENFKVAVYTKISRLAVRTFDQVIAVSDSQRAKAIRWGVDPDRIEVVRNAIDIEEMQSAAIKQPGDLKGIADIIGNGRYMVAVGRLSPEKGHRVLVEAMSQVVRQCPDVRLFIIGEGQEADVLLGQIRTLGLDGHVRLAGFSRQVASYIRHAAMLVNPSYSEGLPNVVLEARALNTPIVATKVGGVPEIIADGCGGWLVAPGDPEAMARAIIRLWEGGDLVRKRLVEEGYGEFRHRFDASLQTECLLGIYDALRGNLNRDVSVGRCV